MRMREQNVGCCRRVPACGTWNKSRLGRGKKGSVWGGGEGVGGVAGTTISLPLSPSLFSLFLLSLSLPPSLTLYRSRFLSCTFVGRQAMGQRSETAARLKTSAVRA